MWLIVEIDGTPGQRLEVHLPYLDVYPHPHGPRIGQLMSITPGLVSRCILRGTSAGWTPTRRLPPFRLDVDDRDLILPELARTPDTAAASPAGRTRTRRNDAAGQGASPALSARPTGTTRR